MAQVLFILLTTFVLIAIIWLFLQKADRQLEFYKLERKLPYQKGDFWRRGWSNSKLRKERWQAFLLFPMLFPIEIDQKNDDLAEIQKSVKKIHIAVYGLLILLVVLAVYSEKVFP